MKNTVLVCIVLSITLGSFFGCAQNNKDENDNSKDVDNTTDTVETEIPDETEEDGDMREITAQEFVTDMGAGWNLGNAMDTENEDETAWGNPITTKAMIDEIAKKGFKTLRLPVTWRFHMGPAPDYIIEEEWMDKVEEIANYALDNGMYVILNIHHDEAWIIPTYEKVPAVKDQLTKVWTQIANRFMAYGDYVIFETLNEPRLEESPEEWNGGTAEGRDAVNQYHQVSVDAIRATGGNNATRKIMVSTYAASTTPNALSDYKVPNEDENVIVSVHSYFPYLFCLDGTDPTWGTETDKNELTQELNTVQDTFGKKGRAVVMGEWGSTFSNNPQDRLAHAEFYAKACIERGICPVWWDNGNLDEFAIFNRNTLEWTYPEIADAIVKAVSNSSSKTK
ncbi:glycoside hydrolase family 5 protein [Zobellia russellii]|uniref:glycoside hydrolase family 5 protein n=1 Tax=Zobellia russellii TaxID=248907 RepID=UPI001BFF45C6|nr:glycoside hydrolase family 5 protein [Zobellia russellii]MBT9188307.1 glycoside hydrolase family 5 protein [Zobellia russellii]